MFPHSGSGREKRQVGHLESVTAFSEQIGSDKISFVLQSQYRDKKNPPSLVFAAWKNKMCRAKHTVFNDNICPTQCTHSPESAMVKKQINK